MVVHQLAAAKRRHPIRPKSGPVVVIKVRPDVWHRAMQLAGGDVTRLRVVDGQTVIVRNSSGRG